MSTGEDQAQPPPESGQNSSLPGDNWLPPGWTTQSCVRTSGTKAGRMDKFYYEPVTGRKFRSRNEVMYYLEHGTPKAKKNSKKPRDNHLPFAHSEGRGSNKRQTKSNTKAKEPPPQKPLDFDFLSVPEKVIWTGTNGSEEAWWPFIGDYKIQESVRNDWDRAFTLVTAESHGAASQV